MSSALTRYRVAAWIVGVLIIPTYLSLILRLAGQDRPGWLTVLVLMHGYCYIAYLATTFDLFRRRRWSLGKLAAVVAAGLLPGFTFVAERRVTADERQSVSASNVSH